MNVVCLRRPYAKGFLCGAGIALATTVIAALLAFTHFKSSPQDQKRCVRPGTEFYTGPWGTLDALRIPLVNAGGTLPDGDERLRDPEWFFEDFSLAEVRRIILSDRNLSLHDRIALLDTKRWTVRSNGCVVTPPLSVVWSLDFARRSRIYALLARSSENYSQCHPFRFSTNEFPDNLASAGLPSSAILRLSRLAYGDTNGICFTDLSIARRLLNPKDFNRLAETLFELPTYRLRLRIDDQTDLPAVVNYWGRGGRTNLIRPLLTSMSRVPNGVSLNISYLLPPFASMRLYTYPEWWEDRSVDKQDCFFTALNFFNARPDTNFFSKAHTDEALGTQYTAVNGNPMFGDLILLLDGTDHAIHAAIYIAGDFVYTKNGVNASEPWVLMKVSDMLLTYYGTSQQSRMIFLRRRDFT